MGHALTTLIRDLHRRRGRERRGLTLAEGVRLVEEAVATGVSCKSVVAAPALETTERGRALKAAVVARGIPVEEVTDQELTELATTEHPQGVLAVIAPRTWTLADLSIDRRAVLVVLDAVQDPGNVGTILRTALAFGARGVIALPGTAELTNPKTLRSGMGAAFRIPALSLPEEILGPFLAEHRVTVATTAADGLPFEPARLPHPVAFVFGNEGAGAASALARGATCRLSIPLAPGVESLNVAVAAGVALFALGRARSR